MCKIFEIYIILIPPTFTVCTYNLWNEERWEQRKEPLEKFLQLHQPDILCVQELRLKVKDSILKAFPSYACVNDNFEGWTSESNIFWNKNWIRCDEHGTEDIDSGAKHSNRRLYWCKLQFGNTPKALFCSTAHYLWAGHQEEKETLINPRVRQAHATLKALNQRAPSPDPAIFCGDLNDHFHPIHVLKSGGLIDCFSALGRDPEPTRPTTPTSRRCPEVCDWLFHRGPIHPVTASAIDFYYGDFAPSDHKPVMAAYRFKEIADVSKV